MRCTYCGSNRHTIALCPKTSDGQSRRNNLRCSYCGGNDHSLIACPKTWTGSAVRREDPELVADFFVKDR